MTDAVLAPIARPAPISPVEILPWAVFGTLLAFVALYFVGVEQSALSVFSGTDIHEFLHDGRHLLGLPCH